jgi:DNA-binding LacI/PurR family transcriptional regulator
MIDPFAPGNSGERRSTAPVFALERRERILARLRHAGSVKVSDLAAALGVSELTVRRDIGALADLGLLSRVHGGAVERSPLDTTSPRVIQGPVPPRYRIGAVVPSLRYYLPQVVLGARTAAASLGAQLVLRGASYDIADQRRQIGSLLAAADVHGLLVAPETDGPDAHALLDWLRQLPVPVVLVERTVPPALRYLTLEWARTDHGFGGVLAVRHFAERGHLRMGIVTSTRSPTSRHLRIGWQTALEELGVEGVVDMDLGDELEDEVGDHPLIDEVLEQVHRSGCTALLVHSDRHALLIQQRAADLGWNMPDALALIAYDDELAESGHPPITALGPPKQQLGRAAVELIVARLREPGKPKQRIDLLPDLRVRESSR